MALPYVVHHSHISNVNKANEYVCGMNTNSLSLSSCDGVYAITDKNMLSFHISIWKSKSTLDFVIVNFIVEVLHRPDEIYHGNFLDGMNRLESSHFANHFTCKLLCRLHNKWWYRYPSSCGIWMLSKKTKRLIWMQ